MTVQQILDRYKNHAPGTYDDLGGIEESWRIKKDRAEDWRRCNVEYRDFKFPNSLSTPAFYAFLNKFSEADLITFDRALKKNFESYDELKESQELLRKIQYLLDDSSGLDEEQALVNKTSAIDSSKTKRLSLIFQAETQLRMESLIFKVDKIYNIKGGDKNAAIDLLKTKFK